VSRRARILVVDDHQVVREGIRAAIEQRADLELVGTCASGEEALEMTDRLRPSIVVMDISMPRLNGVETTFKIKREHPTTKIVVFSMHSFRDVFPELLRAGISAYVEKSKPIAELYRAIDIVLAGGTYFSEDISEMLSLQQAQGGDPEQERDLFELLSPREREIFQLVAEGLSVKQISELLHISPKTVATHKAHIMEKLQIKSVSEWVKTAIRRKIIAS
jgi:two-component system, NarL family, response regulator NreC